MIIRRFVLRGLVAASTLIAMGSGQAEIAGDAVRQVEIKSSRLAGFEKANPARKRFGRLEFRGGLFLTSDSDEFGGLSDLIMAPDGRRFTAISDGGRWLSGRIAYEGDRPTELGEVRIGPLLATSGRVLERKRDHDAEGITLLGGDLGRGTVLVAFERSHRIGRFPVRDGAISAPTGYLKLPAETRRMKSNKGFEAITVLRGGPYKGSVLAFAERLAGDAERNHTGWIWVKDVPQRVTLNDIGEFDITGVAGVGDGSVVLLERRFRWMEGVKMRLRHVAAAALAPGRAVASETLFEADMGYEIDNMEGLAVHAGANGETVLTLISDNNFNNLWQRTLLLQFVLLAEDGRSASDAR
jgi:hypothetical protein